jgi:protein subunit release factor B
MGKFPVSEKKEAELLREMEILGIDESEIEEKFIKCSAHGGQKVNKASTGVYIKHNPTGIEIKFTKERSQGLNRFFARRMLVEKIKEMMGFPTEKSKKIERIRKIKQKSRTKNRKIEGT